MAEQSDKSDSDSLDVEEIFLRKLKVHENSEPETVSANKLFLNDFRQHRHLWDETHEAYGFLPPIHFLRMLEAKHNLEQGQLDTKWNKIQKYYEESIRMGKLSWSDDESPPDTNNENKYPYSNEKRSYKPIIKGSKKAAKPEKRRHSDDEPTHSKRNVNVEPAFDQLGEESSSQSVSLETRPGSHQDTDSQNSSKLLSQDDSDSVNSPQLKAMSEKSDRATQTSSSYQISEDSDSSILESVISIHNQLDQPKRKEFDKKLAKLMEDHATTPSSSEDSSAAQ